MKIVYEGGVGEVTEKKSRFIATVHPAQSEEEAAVFIAEMKKKYWDARHNCSAFVIGAQNEMTRCSDDGEPSQTAGRPMLDVLLREDIHNAAVVVTRYFGGTLLGTGGLVRAYQKAVQEGLAHSVILDRIQGKRLDIRTDYNGLGRIQYLLAQQEISVIGTDYTQDAEIHAIAPLESAKKLARDLTEATGGEAVLCWGETVDFALAGSEIKIFKKGC